MDYAKLCKADMTRSCGYIAMLDKSVESCPKKMHQRLDREWSSVTNMGAQVPFERQSSSSEKNKLIGDRLNKPTKTFRKKLQI